MRAHPDVSMLLEIVREASARRRPSPTSPLTLLEVLKAYVAAAVQRRGKLLLSWPVALPHGSGPLVLHRATVGPRQQPPPPPP
jgi:hypothetical protein